MSKLDCRAHTVLSHHYVVHCLFQIVLAIKGILSWLRFCAENDMLHKIFFLHVQKRYVVALSHKIAVQR